jgi:Domain of unknown function (DUF4349)
MTSPETLELEAVDNALAGRYVAPEHAELAELALLLRDDRPEPDPAWATQLDRRVEAGFPARPRERKLWVWFRNVSPALGLATAVVLLVIGAATLPGGGDDSEEGGGAGSAATQEAPATDGAASGSEELAPTSRDEVQQLPPPRSGGGDPGSDRRRTREQQRSATLTLAVPRREIDRAANRVGQVAAELGGFVASSSVSSNGGGHLQLRVPSDRLDSAIQRLSQIGRVRELSRRSVDITSNVVSARDRLAEARAERKSLLTQLAGATTVNETESIRARLDIVSAEIASARRRLARVNNQANFADVSVTLAARGAADDEEGAWTPGDAFRDALRVLEVAAGVALIAAAVALPLVLVWLLIWLGRRGMTRRARERALDMA